MAVNINTVYQRVLALANKEQRGYITPLEFNLLANQAQMEIFEQYFYDINLYNRAPGNSTEYADMLHILEEKISFFKINDTALVAPTFRFSDEFEIDSTSNWTATGSGSISHVAPASGNSFNGGFKMLQTGGVAVLNAASNTTFTLTDGKKYIVNYSVIDHNTPDFYQVQVNSDSGNMVANSTVTQVENGEFSFTFEAQITASTHFFKLVNGDNDNEGKYITFGYVRIKEVDNTSIGNSGTNTVYRLGEVMWKRSGQSYVTQVPLVNANEITKYNVSPLARPTSSNPVYVRISDTSIKLYPTPTSTDTITHNFITRPVEVYWGYTVVPNSSGGNEYPMYNASTSQNFELHESEEMPLVYKILELAGIVINKPGLVQAASLEQQENLQQEKQ